ncbi:FISUMP domain-containing protein [Flavivirga amylovorans]|uniref:FISUMP domain-containing protein n=1 Tax=Flavivirga amylovorans TaxID=870486 RepID=A0ABT8WY07_9FLAO|nr:FISUMP domain-containing protein [Flavivirga amylovorans]MDO5986230.1 FISUMP domain-containing protein [Flavivirga amylovorans]
MMKYINKIFLIVIVMVFIPLISCEDDDEAFVEKKPIITLVSPEDKLGNVDIAPMFEWEASDPNERPLKFDFLLGIDSTKLFIQAENLKENSYTLTDYKLRKDVTYYWSVIAKNGIEKQEAPIRSFTSIPAPGAPVLTGPGADIFIRDVLTFEWEPVAAGEGESISYNVFLGKSNPPTDAIGVVNDGSTSFAFDASTLDVGSVYYWKVDATDLINNSSSEIRSFKKLASGAPDEPLIVSPIEGSGVMAGTTLDWTDVTDPEGDAVSYDVYLDKLNEPVTLVTTVTTSEYTPVGLDVNSAYYWYVVAKDPSDNSTPSQISGFANIGGSPGFPQINPFAVSGVLSLDEILTWQAAAGATSYDVYVDTVNPPLNLVASDITETEYLIKNTEIPSDLTDVKTYYALVVAKDGVGGVTNSFPVEFTPQMTGVYTDTRSEEVLDYNWVRIGTQIWMSQNLRTKKFTDGENLVKVVQPTSGDYPITASSTESFYDDHPATQGVISGFPTFMPPWSDGDNGRVYSHNVRSSPLIAPSGWHVLNDDDISTIMAYVPQANDLLADFHGGTDLYGANLIIAGYRYNNFNAGRPFGFRYGVEAGRASYWIDNTGANNVLELYPAGNYRLFNQSSPHNRMFGIRLVKD